MPEAYADFLFKNGVDLNWVFNKDDNEGNVFRKEDNINNSADKLLKENVDKNTFINRGVAGNKTSNLYTH